MRAPEFWQAGSRSVWPTLLTPLSVVWAVAARMRQGGVRPTQAEVPVICIGNLIAGGAGKTPTAIAMARLLQACGVSAHFISKGYGGREIGPVRVETSRHDAADVGDESLLLARVAPTWVARQRPAAIAAAVAGGAGLVILDDGFQDPAIVKDLSLIVIDGAYGIGNGRVMPAGPLREPVTTGLRRADGAVIVGPCQFDPAFCEGRPVFKADIEPVTTDFPADRPIAAFAGIGRPQKFFDMLQKIGCNLVGTRAFPDHHRYDDRDIDQLVDWAAEQNAQLVTTEKDAVRLPATISGSVVAVPIRLTFEQPDRVFALLRDLVPSLASVLPQAPDPGAHGTN